MEAAAGGQFRGAGVVVHLYDPDSPLSASLDLLLEDKAGSYMGTRWVGGCMGGWVGGWVGGHLAPCDMILPVTPTRAPRSPQSLPGVSFPSLNFASIRFGLLGLGLGSWIEK